MLGDIPLHPDSRPGFLSDAVGAWAARRAAEFGDRADAAPLHELISGQMSVSRAAFLQRRRLRDGLTPRAGAESQSNAELDPNTDLDLGHRLVGAGYRIGFNPDAVSRHRYVVTPRQYLDRWREVGRADVIFARKHPDAASTIFVAHRRERLSDRLLWRWLRRPLRLLVLAAAGAGAAGRARPGTGSSASAIFEYFTGIREAGGIPARRPVRVLCYHAIADLAGFAGHEPYGVPAPAFRRQLALLQRHFHFISGSELVASLAGAGLPRRPVLLTFDDCYADLVETALPILGERRIPAVAFAVTRRLGGTNDWSSRGGPPRRLLDAGGLARLARAGVEIGSHTRTHRALTRLADAELDDELRGSADDLAATRPRPPRPARLPLRRPERRRSPDGRGGGLRGRLDGRGGTGLHRGRPLRAPPDRDPARGHRPALPLEGAGRRPLEQTRARAGAARAAESGAPQGAPRPSIGRGLPTPAQEIDRAARERRGEPGEIAVVGAKAQLRIGAGPERVVERRPIEQRGRQKPARSSSAQAPPNAASAGRSRRPPRSSSARSAEPGARAVVGQGEPEGAKEVGVAARQLHGRAALRAGVVDQPAEVLRVLL